MEQYKFTGGEISQLMQDTKYFILIFKLIYKIECCQAIKNKTFLFR